MGIRLLTRRGNDWAARFPLVVVAVNHLKVRSCMIDGEVVCCDERGLAIFSTLNEHLEHPEGDVVFRHTCNATGHQPIAVVLDLVNPVGARRRLVGRAR